jgi:hypothetical protein
VALTDIGEEGRTRQNRIRAWAVDRQDPDISKGLNKSELQEKSAEVLDVDQDLDAFEDFRGEKGSKKFFGEYHKEGAPDMEKEGLSDYTPSPQEDRPPGERVSGGIKIDVGTVEVLAYAFFRAVFGSGLKVPIQREGMVNMDVTFVGRDVVINTKELYFDIPDLVVWKIIYEHKDKPVAEFGRGVKNGMKLHYLQVFKLLMEMWTGSRKRKKEKASLAMIASQAGENA